MLSRGVVLGRLIKNCLDKYKIAGNPQSKRMSSVANYRVSPPPHSKFTIIGAEVVGGCMWWWILWHLWHEFDHITGEFEYPDTAAWTNSELGIPSD